MIPTLTERPGLYDFVVCSRFCNFPSGIIKLRILLIYYFFTDDIFHSGFQLDELTELLRHREIETITRQFIGIGDIHAHIVRSTVETFRMPMIRFPKRL